MEVGGAAFHRRRSGIRWQSDLDGGEPYLCEPAIIRRSHGDVGGRAAPVTCLCRCEHQGEALLNGVPADRDRYVLAEDSVLIGGDVERDPHWRRVSRRLIDGAALPAWRGRAQLDRLERSLVLVGNVDIAENEAWYGGT